MNKYEWLEGFLLEKPEAVKSFKVEWDWFLFTVRGKMFAGLFTLSQKYHPRYLGRPIINLKCEPAFAELFCRQYEDIIPGIYASKEHWVSVFLDGEVPDDVLRFLCSMSYDLVVHGLPKKVQKEISDNIKHN